MAARGRCGAVRERCCRYRSRQLSHHNLITITLHHDFIAAANTTRDKTVEVDLLRHTIDGHVAKAPGLLRDTTSDVAHNATSNTTR